MERISKFFDLTTSVALPATVVGIVLCLFFLFAPTTFGKNLPETVVNGPVDIQVSLRWIQPILGQAIVEDTLIKQQHGHHIDWSRHRSVRLSRGAQLMRRSWKLRSHLTSRILKPIIQPACSGSWGD